MAIQLTNEDPAIGELVSKLLELPLEVQRSQAMDAFIQGIHTTHVNLHNIDSTTNSELPTPPTTSNEVPEVKRSLVRQVLLRLIPNPALFVEDTLAYLEDYVPGMAIRIRRVGVEDYKLLASFTAFCIIGEVQQRGSELSVIEIEDIKHPNPRIAEILSRINPTRQEMSELQELLSSFNQGILQEIKITNPHLYWGIATFLNSLGELSGQRLSAGVNGAIHQYNAIKASLS